MDIDTIIKDELIEATRRGYSFYQNIINNKFQPSILEINCKDLVDYDNSGKGEYDLPESLKISFFRGLDKLLLDNEEKSLTNKKPCLYFLKFDAGLAESILAKYRNYRSIDNLRNKSSLKPNPNIDTNILYVGKVLSNVGARLSTHFGYASPKVGGLQLKHWARDMELKLKIHLIIFHEDIGNFINPLELEFTRLLKPLIGNSK
ncbi:hypothetical protein [Perlabentimonas gracilis]|uniref:hypothetical protein n=1 Tax=Perlabentimonas gracilis TaxID=2715279 RepID=UPI0014097C4E|nr:hypothetical protein [Perlabentimonas gracilis]NHB69605.1 hypothetical protein [Perlabentimonas gracilis]